MFLQSQQGRELVDRLKLNIPVIKSIYIQIYLIQMMRILALVFEKRCQPHGGVGTLQRRCPKLHVFVRFIEGLSNDVMEGRKLSPRL